MSDSAPAPAAPSAPAPTAADEHGRPPFEQTAKFDAGDSH